MKLKKSPETHTPKRQHVIGADADLQRRLGAGVRARRHFLNITQEELAERSDLHRTYIADVERGARNVTLRSASNLARALGLSIGHLLAHIAPPAAAETSDPKATALEVRDILLVEHDVAAAAATAQSFKRAKLANPLRIVRDGEAALDYLFGRGRYLKRPPARPELILLVCDLPRMSGTEFMQRLKADERTRNIPVVVLKVHGAAG